MQKTIPSAYTVRILLILNVALNVENVRYWELTDLVISYLILVLGVNLFHVFLGLGQLGQLFNRAPTLINLAKVHIYTSKLDGALQLFDLFVICRSETSFFNNIKQLTARFENEISRKLFTILTFKYAELGSSELILSFSSAFKWLKERACKIGIKKNRLSSVSQIQSQRAFDDSLFIVLKNSLQNQIESVDRAASIVCKEVTGKREFIRSITSSEFG